jgi:hypothetical protein
LLIPLSIGVSVLRYRLFEFDVIIRKTLIYGVVTGALALVYLGAVLFLQSIFRAATGQNNQMALVLSTLAIAALFNPLRARVQESVDRKFYRKKYNAEHTLAAYSNALREGVDLRQVHDLLVQLVDDTLQPSSISLWLKGRTETIEK